MDVIDKFNNKLLTGQSKIKTFDNSSNDNNKTDNNSNSNNHNG